MISVCIPTYNGASYIVSQLESILGQLSSTDEVIISDGSSTDRTVEIIQTLNDPRIKIYTLTSEVNPYTGIFHKIYQISRNVENALSQARGEYVFLSDQDDYWLPHKVATVMEQLQRSDMVIHNCTVTDPELKPVIKSYFTVTKPRPTLIGLLRKSSFMGCCMAFRRTVLDKALPFPQRIAVEHDAWIGICALKHADRIAILDEPLIYYRRHNNNASTCAEKSRNPLWSKLKRRWILLQAYFLCK